MRLTLSICCLALFGLIKPGFTTPAEIQSNSALSDGMVSLTMDQEETLFSLFRLQESISTPDQKEMVYRIMDRDSDCHETRMLCQVDGFLRNLAKNLLQNGVTEIPMQVDMDKFERLLARILSTMDREDMVDRFSGMNSTVLEQANEEFELKSQKGSEYKAFNRLTLEFENLLMNRADFSPAKLAAPFIISDMELKQDAIEHLVDSKAFQLKPLNKYGKFYELGQHINGAIKSSSQDVTQRQTLEIPLRSVVKKSALLPGLSESDWMEANKAIDQSNAALLDLLEVGEIMMVDQLFRSLVGDLLGIVLDLPGKLLGSGGSGSRKGGSGISITIDLGGGGSGEDEDEDDEEYEEPKPKKKPSKPTTTKRKPSATKTPAKKSTPTESSE